MGRIVVMNHVSLDGVMQGPGRPGEDDRGGFAHSGWALSDETAGRAMGERMAAGGGLAGWLFGRWTYEDLLGHWTRQEDSPFGPALVGSPKYVVSSTLPEPAPWPHTTVLRGDAVRAVREVKEQVDGVLVVMGSGRLIASLLLHDLIDEYLLLVNPLVLGSGQRLFPDGSAPTRLRCLSATRAPSGLVITSYARESPTER